MSTAFLAKLKTELPTIEINISFVYSRHCISHKLRYFMSRTLTSTLQNSPVGLSTEEATMAALPRIIPRIIYCQTNTLCYFVICKPWLAQIWTKPQTGCRALPLGLTTRFRFPGPL